MISDLGSGLYTAQEIVRDKAIKPPRFRLGFQAQTKPESRDSRGIPARQRATTRKKGYFPATLRRKSGYPNIPRSSRLSEEFMIGEVSGTLSTRYSEAYVPPGRPSPLPLA